VTVTAAEVEAALFVSPP
jgi:hypothetical protein